MSHNWGDPSKDSIFDTLGSARPASPKLLHNFGIPETGEGKMGKRKRKSKFCHYF
jgi:hypothetical protein